MLKDILFEQIHLLIQKKLLFLLSMTLRLRLTHVIITGIMIWQA